MAAAAAMAALDSLLICIFDSSIVIERSGIAAHIKDPANALIITQLSKLMPVSIGRQRAPAATQRSVLNDGFLMLVAGASDRGACSKSILCGRRFRGFWGCDQPGYAGRDAASANARRTGSNCAAARSSQSSPRRISEP